MTRNNLGINLPKTSRKSNYGADDLTEKGIKNKKTFYRQKQQINNRTNKVTTAITLGRINTKS